MKTIDESLLAKPAKVLSDPIRIKILHLLKNGRDETCLAPICNEVPTALCPTDLQFKLDQITSSKLSYHLRLLKEEKFITEQREGKRIYYCLQPERVKEVMELLSDLL
ncbi:transcriptional regulator, ArsR family [Seinonella peptonophila]|uniref:Transcriptional regulator, ArsR family n=1 Tax=Seinonella peptonophila TaxID=112248 RepID=A0A1M4TYQ6_9BACL|nr:metalloregulator ArsR/SmtB family transcription factor [Seinonella peptonophila]SHE49550.1 transcriptional regulator, ArsR family [Seinonella peptonophila]